VSPPSRHDHAGSWHSVVNHGIEPGRLFEHPADIRYFLSRLAREVRRGRLEVHAWCVLKTRYHLLVRSPAGELSEAMRRVQNEYSRFYNRRHGRKGTLIPGRFHSRPVESDVYRRLLVRYIHAQSVELKLVEKSQDYPWSSAWYYARETGPAWLERSWVVSEVRSLADMDRYEFEMYGSIFAAPPGEGASRLIEDRMQCPAGQDDLDDLIPSSPPRVRRWLERMSRHADDSAPHLPVCNVASIREAVTRGQEAAGDWLVTPGVRRRDAWKVAEAGLLRALAGMSLKQIALATGFSPSTCARYTELHTERLRMDPEYAERTSDLAEQALAICFAARG
jgi:hypothetical protein